MRLQAAVLLTTPFARAPANPKPAFAPCRRRVGTARRPRPSAWWIFFVRPCSRIYLFSCFPRQPLVVWVELPAIGDCTDSLTAPLADELPDPRRPPTDLRMASLSRSVAPLPTGERSPLTALRSTGAVVRLSAYQL